MIVVGIGVIKARVPNIPKIARDLISGTLKPDKIVFCISREPYLLDEGIKEGSIKKFKCPNCEFKVVKNNGPIRRIVPLVREYWDKPDTKIIIFDDDRKPGHDTVAKLVNYSNKHPNVAVGAAGNMMFGYKEKQKWQSKGVIFDSRHHKKVGIVLGWGITQPIEVDILNPGVGILVKPRFFNSDFINWEEVYHPRLGINQTDQTFISYSLKKNGIKRMVIQLGYVPEYPHYNKQLCGHNEFLSYKIVQLRTFFKAAYLQGVPQL